MEWTRYRITYNGFKYSLFCTGTAKDAVQYSIGSREEIYTEKKITDKEWEVTDTKGNIYNVKELY